MMKCSLCSGPVRDDRTRGNNNTIADRKHYGEDNNMIADRRYTRGVMAQRIGKPLRVDAVEGYHLIRGEDAQFTEARRSRTCPHVVLTVF